jgi:hypothetical protein
MVFLSFPRRGFWKCGSGRGEEPGGQEGLHLIQIPLAPLSLTEIIPARQANSPQARGRRFQFQKCSQLLIGVHDETLSIITMRVHNPNRSPFKVQS